MKKCWFFVCVSMILVLLVTSCSLGLDPAKSGSTEVRLSVGEATAGRIIAPGTGYLYVRTVGGPTGDNGPFYGPYQLSAGSVFTTTDIPAGSYDAFGILYATEPLEGLNTSDLDPPYRDQSYIQLMSLPDAEFLDFTEGSHPSNFDILINGRATAEMLENVRIVAGQRNVIGAKLMPVIGEIFLIAMTDSFDDQYVTGSEPIHMKRYFKLEISPVNPEAYNELIINYRVYTETPSSGSFTIFDENGRILGGDVFYVVDTIDKQLSIPYSGQSIMYGCIDFIGNEIGFRGSLYP